MDNTDKKPKGAGKSSFKLIDSNKLKTILPIKSGSVVIDLACGKGIYSMFLSGIVGEKGLIYAVIEFKKIEGPPGPPAHIRLSEAEVEKMVTRHGFVKKQTVDIGAYNYLMTFL